jgi:uncharacterized membrane protein YfcA
MTTVLAGSLIICFAAAMQALTGFGFAVMAVPLLLIMYAPHDAVPISMMVSTVTTSFLAIQLRKEVEWRLLRRLLIGSVIGAPFGLWLYNRFDLTLLKLFISTVILAVVTVMMRNVRFRLSGERYDYVAGLISGFMTTSVGIPGPPLLVFLVNRGLEKGPMRATSATFFLVIYLISLSLHFFWGDSIHLIDDSLMLVPAALAGSYIGQKLDNKVDQRLFQRLIYAILLISGVYTLISTLWGMFN